MATATWECATRHNSKQNCIALETNSRWAWRIANSCCNWDFALGAITAWHYSRTDGRTDSQSSRGYNNNLPRRCYKLQADKIASLASCSLWHTHHLAFSFSLYQFLFWRRSKFLVHFKHRMKYALKILLQMSPKRLRINYEQAELKRTLL